MITPDDDITIPKPTKKRGTVSQKALTLFAVTGVIGLGLCGMSIAGDRVGNAAFIGFLFVIASLVGLVITAVCMAIASILRATEKTTEKK